MTERKTAGVDPAVLAVLGDGERRGRLRGLRPGDRRRAKRDRARSKVTYDLPPRVAAAIAAIAAEEDCSASSVAAFLLHRGAAAYRAGEISFEGHFRPSRSPRFGWVVEVPEAGGEENGKK